MASHKIVSTLRQAQSSTRTEVDYDRFSVPLSVRPEPVEGFFLSRQSGSTLRQAQGSLRTESYLRNITLAACCLGLTAFSGFAQLAERTLVVEHCGGIAHKVTGAAYASLQVQLAVRGQTAREMPGLFEVQRHLLHQWQVLGIGAAEALCVLQAIVQPRLVTLATQQAMLGEHAGEDGGFQLYAHRARVLQCLGGRTTSMAADCGC